MTTNVKDRNADAKVTAHATPHVLKDYRIHPIAALWPLLGEAELQDMATDIKLHGLQEAVWLYDGEVLDGRNRLVACTMAQVKPTFQTWKPQFNETPLSFIMSKNLHRRHLGASVRAAIAVEIEEMLAEEQARKAEEAKAKQALFDVSFTDEKDRTHTTEKKAPTPTVSPFSGGGPGANTDHGGSKPAPQGRVRDRAAAAAGVSTGYLADAKDMKHADSGMYQRVASGELTLGKAQEELVSAAEREGSLKTLPLREGTKNSTIDRLNRRKKKPKPPIKFTKVKTSRTTVHIDVTFGSSQKAEVWMNKMQDEPSVLELAYTVDD